jgi:hypothetical protein
MTIIDELEAYRSFSQTLCLVALAIVPLVSELDGLAVFNVILCFAGLLM